MDANPQIVPNNVSISISNIPTVQISGDNVTLQFSNLTRSNDGHYKITITNSEGSHTENFTLLVYCK